MHRLVSPLVPRRPRPPPSVGGAQGGAEEEGLGVLHIHGPGQDGRGQRQREQQPQQVRQLQRQTNLKKGLTKSFSAEPCPAWLCDRGSAARLATRAAGAAAAARAGWAAAAG